MTTHPNANSKSMHSNPLTPQVMKWVKQVFHPSHSYGRHIAHERKLELGGGPQRHRAPKSDH
jgi:hypothetical protein